ncbi:DUF4932 domain-containing protein [uncultured Alistipes sp.]|uniref:DUF4932 domain-containing protein n=1 Tax=uncultured Alistipes sp. TaxID=538949 RepID=UPI003452A518
MTSCVSELRGKYGVSHDAVPNTAAFLETRNGNACIGKDADVSETNGLEARWPEHSFRTFAAYLNDFRKTSDFDGFHRRHSAYYENPDRRFDVLCGECRQQ